LGRIAGIISPVFFRTEADAKKQLRPKLGSPRIAAYYPPANDDFWKGRQSLLLNLFYFQQDTYKKHIWRARPQEIECDNSFWLHGRILNSK
jgi:hypothetical protein